MRLDVLDELAAVSALPGSPLSLVSLPDVLDQPAGREPTPALPADLPRPVDLHDVKPKVEDFGSAHGTDPRHVGGRHFDPVQFLHFLSLRFFCAGVRCHRPASIFRPVFLETRRVGFLDRNKQQNP